MSTSHHPAPYSAPILERLTELTKDWEGPILDPYAGIGRIHAMGRDDTYGTEIEPEFAQAHPRTAVADSATIRFGGVVKGDDKDLITWGAGDRFWPRPNAIITSPDYGNRMADQYLGTPAEQAARAETGRLPRRRSYAISLGRRVTEGSGAGHKFGPQYKAIHKAVMSSVTSVCLPGTRMALNVSDSIAGFKEQMVFAWWANLAITLNWRIDELLPTETARFRDGSNSELRADHEWIILATLAS